MALDRRLVLEAAEKALQQGRLPAAIADFERLLQDSPDDAGLLNRIGDLYLRSQRNDRATTVFLRLATHYRNKGFDPKAAAIFKKVLKLEPLHDEAREGLARLALDQGMVRDAQETLREGARLHAARSDWTRAVTWERRALEARPDDWEGHRSLASRLRGAGDLTGAVRVHLRAAIGLNRAGRLEDALAMCREALVSAPLDGEAPALLARLLIQSGRAAEAVRDLEAGQRGAQRHPAVHAWLAQARSLAEGVAIPPEDEPAENGDAAELVAVAWGRLARGDEGGGVVALARAAALMTTAGDPLPAASLVAEAVTAWPAMPGLLDLLLTQVGDGSGPGPEDSSVAILVEALLTAGRAHDALPLLRRLQAARPRDRDLQRRLRETERQCAAGPRPRADQRGAAATGVSDPAPAEPADGKPAAPLPDGADGAVVDAEFVAEHLTEADVFVKYRLLPKAAAHLRLIIERYPSTLVAHQRLVEVCLEMGDRETTARQYADLAEVHRRRGTLDEARRAVAGALDCEPENPSLLAMRDALRDGQILPPYAPFRRAPRPPAARPAMARAAPAGAAPAPVLAAAGGPAAAGPSPPPDLKLEEETLDFDMELPPVVTAAAPPSTGARAVAPPPPPRPAAPVAAAPPADFFDLAGAIRAELERDDETATSVPIVNDRDTQTQDPASGIRRAIQDQVGDGDHQTHYQLGIAFKEMGLLDEAIGEFQQASRGGGDNFGACCSMLGLCFRAKGLPEIAEKWYRRGLEKAGGLDSDPAQRLGLLYDLAELQLEGGDDRGAIDHLMEVYAHDAGYRDVAARLNEVRERLSAAATGGRPR